MSMLSGRHLTFNHIYILWFNPVTCLCLS